MKYAKELEKVRQLLEDGDFGASVKKSGLIFERGLRQLVQEIVAAPESVTDRDKILTAEK